jgi:hypothetical protein
LRAKLLLRRAQLLLRVELLRFLLPPPLRFARRPAWPVVLQSLQQLLRAELLLRRAELLLRTELRLRTKLLLRRAQLLLRVELLRFPLPPPLLPARRPPQHVPWPRLLQ